MIDFTKICRKLRPFLGNKIDELYMEYTLADSQEKKQEIYQVIMALYSKYVDSQMLDENVILRIPKEGLLRGEYDLGRIEYPNKRAETFALRDRDWPRHVCVTGMSGSGKTTFAVRMINSLIEKKKPFLVFDWKKSFRQLLHLSDDVIIFTVGRPKASNLFRLNINCPPKGVAPDEWITVVCDLICECYGASYGVHKLLTEVMQRAFREFGVYSGSENYPTWYQIRDRLEYLADKVGRHSRHAEWLTSALRIAHSLTFGEFGQTINDKSRFNLPIEEILQSQVVLELDSLGTYEKKMYCSFLLLYIYKHMKSNTTEIASGFKSAVFVDEAHNIFLKQRPTFVTESVTDTIYREIREYGIGLVCLDQHASKLSETVLGNSSTTIAFQQILPADVDTISRLMFLYDERQVFTRLEVGTAVVKLTDRWHEPFMVKVEPVDVPRKLIDDKDLRKLVKGHCMFKKKLKLWEQLMESDRLAEDLANLEIACDKSRTKYTEEDLIWQIHNDMRLATFEEKKSQIVNHLQKQIFDDAVQMIRKKGSVKNAKKAFIAEGYTQSDVNKAFKYFRDTREGAQVIRFLDLWKSHSQNNNIDPIWVLDFMKKLRDVGENLPTSKLYELLSVSIRRGNEIKKNLVDIGFIDVREHRTDKGLTKRLGFTLKGNEFMDKLGIA